MNAAATTTQALTAVQSVCAACVFATLVCIHPEYVNGAVVASYAESLCETVTPQACDPRDPDKPTPPSMITPLTGVFTDQPRFEWRRASNASIYLLSVVELNDKGAIIATFSRNITPQVRCIDQVCAVTSTSLGFRLQPDAATFDYRLIASNDSGSSATPKTTVQIQ